jgi:TolB protein
MPIPPLDGKYASGKRRPRLFSDSPKKRVFIPLGLILFGFILIIFWIVPVYRMEPILPLKPEEIATTTPHPTNTPSPTPTSPFSSFGGRIVFTCTRSDVNQICSINADGSDFVQLTDGFRNKYYPNFTPDMTAIVFAQNEGDYFDIYKLSLIEATLTRLTEYVGNAFSPKYSPDGSQILFLNRPHDGITSLWVMGPDGENPQILFDGGKDIVGADWSPDGSLIAFAMEAGVYNTYEIYLLDVKNNGKQPLKVTEAVEGVTGSLDWSLDGKSLLVCMGSTGNKNVYRLDLATGNAIQLTFGGNNASASYSPDGQYIIFNSLRNNGQADLYIIRADGHSTQLLMDNPEPDWQPVWGP